MSQYKCYTVAANRVRQSIRVQTRIEQTIFLFLYHNRFASTDYTQHTFKSKHMCLNENIHQGGRIISAPTAL